MREKARAAALSFWRYFHEVRSKNFKTFLLGARRAGVCVLALVVLLSGVSIPAYAEFGGKIDRYDYKACKKAITKFFDNFRTRHASHFIYILVPERHKDGAWHFHGLVVGIPAGEFYTPEFITYRDRRSQELKVIRNTKGYMRWRRWPYGHFDCSVIKDYEASATYVSKYITKDLISVMKGAHLYFSSKGLRRPSLVFDEDNVPFPMKPQYSDEFCKLSWASGGDVIGDLLPSWYDDMCADIRDIDSPERLTERALFSELTVEQLSLLESAEQVSVPWD